MTACPRPEHLYLYLEGELGPYDAAKLEEHVECCAACRDALAERRVLHEAFTGLPPFEVPEDFARSVMDRLPEPEVRKAGWLAPLVAAVAALSVSLLGFNLFTGTSVLEVLVAVSGFFGSALARTPRRRLSPRDEQIHRLRLATGCGRPGQGERWNDAHHLSRNAQRLAARSQDRH